MYDQMEKQKHSKIQAFSNSAFQKLKGAQRGVVFEDNRHAVITQRKLPGFMNAGLLVKQRKCTLCSEKEEDEGRITQRKANSTQSVLQRAPCHETDHNTSLEHMAIENEFANRTGAKKEYEIPKGSVDKNKNGTNKTGYADLADEAGKKIYDVKRSNEGYPEAQLAQYIKGANASCGDGWGKGTAYGGPRVIPFTEKQNIRAYQDGEGVISYTKEHKGVKSISSFFSKKKEHKDDDSDDERERDWKADEQMNKLMENAGMFNDDGSWI